MIPTTTADAPRIDLLEAARGQPWSWLTALAERLNIVVEFVNVSGSCGPRISVGPRSNEVRERLAADRLVRTAIDDAIQLGETQRFFDDQDIVVAPLVTATIMPGALVVLREPTVEHSGRSRADFDAVADWIAQAVLAQLETCIDQAEVFDRVPALQRLLREAANQGAERDVFSVFAEALLAWDGVEVKSFAETLEDRYVLTLAAPGADREHPRAIDADGPWIDRSTTRLDPADAAQLGFPESRGVMLSSIGGAGIPRWLIAFSDVAGSLDESRLTVYAGMLSEALVRTAAFEEARVAWTVLPHLLTPTLSPEARGEAALADLAIALRAGSAALIVIAPDGRRILALGKSEAAVRARDTVDGRARLVSALPVPDGCTMVLSVHRAGGDVLLRRDQVLVDRMAAIFAAWIPQPLAAIRYGQDRRAESRTFDVVLERTAAQSVADGADVSVIVIVASGDVTQPGVLHEWVSRMRSQLRASDLAGTLSEREIGVLAAGVSAKDVPALRARLLKQVQLGGAGLPTRALVGDASWGAGLPRGASLVRAARQAAVRHAIGADV